MWSVVDATRGVVVARRVQRADTFARRLVGLLGRPELGEDEGLWIEPCDSIHTFFMRFPIDVAFLDPRGTVIRRLERLPPWRATRLHTQARACLELAPGVLERKGVRDGAHLLLVPAEASLIPARPAEGRRAALHTPAPV